MSDPNPYIPITEMAERLGRSERTLYNYAARRWFTLYKRPGTRATFVNREEVYAALRQHKPSMLGPRYGGARVVMLAEAVTGAEAEEPGR